MNATVAIRYPLREVIAIVGDAESLLLILFDCGHQRHVRRRLVPPRGAFRECWSCTPIIPRSPAVLGAVDHRHFRSDGRGTVQHQHVVDAETHAHVGDPERPDLRAVQLSYGAQLRSSERRTTVEKERIETNSESTESETVREPNDDTGANATDRAEKGQGPSESHQTKD